jgi:hypothetical protein
MTKIRVTLLTGLFFFGLLTTSQGQDTLLTNIPEPEFAFDPMIVNNDFTTTPLQKENVAITVRSTTKKMYYEALFDRTHSLLTIKSNPVKVLIKNGMLNGTLPNPRDVNKLYKLTVDEKKKKRVGVFGELDRGFTGKIEGTNTTLDLPLTLIKVKEGLYLVTLQNLEPGEYALNSGNGYFTFRIE